MRAAAVLLLVCCAANPQGRPLDWPSVQNDAQRTGWERIDSRITKDNIKDFQLVLKRKLENGAESHNSLTPPVVIGLLISYRGFKELGFVAGSSGEVWAIDLDMNRIFWQKRFDASAKGKCASDAAVTPALIPPMNFAVRPRPAPSNGKAAAKSGNAYGAPRPIFAVSADGKLHQMNTSDGEDISPALSFIPSNASASSMTVVDDTVYTTTTDCANGRGTVWALDLKKSHDVAKFVLKEGSASPHGGLAMANDGTVFAQTPGTLYALSPKSLKLAGYFTFPANGPDTTPVVFTYKDKELVAAAGADGRVYLLDAKNPGGADHKTPLFETQPVAGSHIWGGLSTWQDTHGVRWILAPMAGPKGSIVALKLQDRSGKPALAQAWISREIPSPEQPVITSGVVFALSAEDHSVLYALDGDTGKEMWSSGSQVTEPANLTGLTVANGRVFFTTTGGTLYGFGIFLER